MAALQKSSVWLPLGGQIQQSYENVRNSGKAAIDYHKIKHTFF